MFMILEIEKDDLLIWYERLPVIMIFFIIIDMTYNYPQR